MLSTILRQQLINAYNVSKNFRDKMYNIPIELGGYPSSSAFELGVSGCISHNNDLATMVKRSPELHTSIVTLRCIRLSQIYNQCDADTTKFINQINVLTGKTFKEAVAEDDSSYENLTIPNRLELFSCIKHKMPKTSKITKTMDAIKNLPFEGNGLELIVTKPNTLSEALGNLKSQTGTLLFSLAAEKYTQNTRVLASSQSIQATKKVVRIAGLPTLTYEELYNFILHWDIIGIPRCEIMDLSMSDDTNVTNITKSIVYNSNCIPIMGNKRKVISKMPDFEDSYNTNSNMKDVLLYIIDFDNKTKYYELYGNKMTPISLLHTDSLILRKKYAILFRDYKTIQACSMIMRNHMDKLKTRLWIQPRVNNDTIEEFLCNLYGVTIDKCQNYRVEINLTFKQKETRDVKVIDTIYSVCVLNSIYEDKFKIQEFEGVNVNYVLDNIDYTCLNMDDYLKFAIIYKVFSNSDVHLKRYDESNSYAQKYTISQQKKMINGKFAGWHGEFECYVKFGRTIIKIEGEPENNRVTGNTNNINEILMAMMIFVNKNFKFYNYKSPYLWNYSKFWNNKLNMSKTYLTPYTRTCTIITSKQNVESYNYEIDPSIKMPTYKATYISEGYKLSNQLRVVSKIVDNSEVKVGHVKQDLRVPLVSLIQLEEDTIDGLSCSYLLTTKTIINITMGRFHSNSDEEIWDVLKSHSQGSDALPLFKMFAFFCNQFSKSGRISVEDYQYKDEDNQEILDVGDLTAEAFVVKNEDAVTEPESLEAEFLDIELNSSIRYGRMYKHRNVMYTLCSMISREATMHDFISIFKFCLNDEVFFNHVVELVNNKIPDWSKVEFMNVALENAQEHEIDYELYAYIVSNKFDTYLPWYNVNIHEILNKDEFEMSPLTLKMAKLFKKYVLEYIFYEEGNTIDMSALLELI